MNAPQSDCLPHLTLEEFRHFAEAHDGLWELHGGTPVKMQSPSRTHQRLSKKLVIAMDAYFEGRSCEVLQEMDVWVSQEELTDARNKRKDATRKPDLLVYCRESQYSRHVIQSPQLVVEIWSPSNSAMERAEKQALYQTVGVRELWLVDSDTGDFSILTFESKSLVKFSGGNIAADPLESALFPGLTANLSGAFGRDA